jgi:hypothetical protein
VTGNKERIEVACVGIMDRGVTKLKPKTSTFFPSSWTLLKFMKCMEEVYTNPVPLRGHSKSARKNVKEGNCWGLYVRIFTARNASDLITDAYPLTPIGWDAELPPIKCPASEVMQKQVPGPIYLFLVWCLLTLWWTFWLLTRIAFFGACVIVIIWIAFRFPITWKKPNHRKKKHHAHFEDISERVLS